MKQFTMPESGERKRNLTTLFLVKRAAVKRSRSQQKVSESSQNPLKWSCTAGSTRQGRSSEPWPPPKTDCGGFDCHLKLWGWYPARIGRLFILQICNLIWWCTMKTRTIPMKCGRIMLCKSATWMWELNWCGYHLGRTRWTQLGRDLKRRQGCEGNVEC